MAATAAALGRRRVAVTGIGMVSPLGLSAPATWSRLVAGGSGISALDASVVGSSDSGPDAKLSSRIGGVIHDFDREALAAARGGAAAASLASLELDPRRMARFTLFALAAADEALAAANLAPVGAAAADTAFAGRDVYDPTRAGVAIGSGIGSLADISAAAATLESRGPSRLSPHFVPKVLVNLAAGQVAIRHELRGPNHSVSTACATGAHSIGDAFRMIRDGDADVMVAGGTEACVDRLSVAGFTRLRALSTQFNDAPEEASRPFDTGRDGFVIAEGACVLVLEELDAGKLGRAAFSLARRLSARHACGAATAPPQPHLSTLHSQPSRAARGCSPRCADTVSRATRTTSQRRPRTVTARSGRWRRRS